jgi:acetyl esterase/lipase
VQRVRSRFLCALAALAAVAGACAYAQTSVVPVWPGPPPGTEQWTQKERTYANTPVGTVIMNVSKPTLTAYLPASGKSTRTAVIIAPGGACVALTVGREGADVARSFTQHGIAAFVLKYRIPEKKGQGIPKDLNMEEACKYGMADAVQAVRVVRARAAQWNILPNRIGMLGFSAGAMVATAALLTSDAGARPNFVGLMYGAPFGTMPRIPAHLPPVFMAWAQDDPQARDVAARFFGALETAGDNPEAHIFSAGGHGFGVTKQGTTSDYWIDEFFNWMSAQHF